MIDEKMKPTHKFHKYPKTKKGAKARQEYVAKATKVWRDRNDWVKSKEEAFVKRKQTEQLRHTRMLMQLADEAVQEMYALEEAENRLLEQEHVGVKVLRWLCR